MGESKRPYNAKAYPFRSRAPFWLCYLIVTLAALAFFIMGFVIFLRDKDDLRGTADDVKLRKVNAIKYHDLLSVNFTWYPNLETSDQAWERHWAEQRAAYKDAGYHFRQDSYIWLAQNIAMPVLVLLVTVLPIDRYRYWIQEQRGVIEKPEDREYPLAGTMVLLGMIRGGFGLTFSTLYGLSTEGVVSGPAISRIWALLLMLFGCLDLAFLFGHLFWRRALPPGHIGDARSLATRDVEMLQTKRKNSAKRFGTAVASTDGADSLRRSSPPPPGYEEVRGATGPLQSAPIVGGRWSQSSSDTVVEDATTQQESGKLRTLDPVWLG